MKLKKIPYLPTVIFVIAIMAVPLLARAARLVNPLGGNDTFEEVIKNVITGAIGISGVLALIAFILGGVTWMISGGDSSKIKKGKDMMIWAVMGLVIIFSAYAILTFIFTTLGVGGGGSNIGENII